MRITVWFYFLVFWLDVYRLSAQYGCGIQKLAFQSGEELYYKVNYNWGMIWLESAQASFKVKTSVQNGRNCYHFVGAGATFQKYDWFYKVNDVFESYVDSSSFRPVRFKADIHEGHKKDKHHYIFNNVSKRAYTFITRGKKPTEQDTLKIAACSIDVLTAIYYARSLDYSKCKVNDTIGMSLLLDGKLFPIYVRYLGEATFDAGKLGKFNCIKFSPLLVEGSIFKSGEGMTVWVSNDENKLPLYIETPIIVGTIKVSLISYKGLKYPSTAKLNQ